jgi:hypothetical protein
MSLIKSGTAAAVLDRSPEESAKAQRLAPRDDSFSELKAVASKLQAPTQIDVLADGESLVESADVLERVAPHRHVAAPRCIEKPKLPTCGRGSECGWERRGNVVERRVVKRTPREICVGQRVDPTLHPSRMHYVICVTKGEDASAGISSSDVPSGRWSIDVGRVDQT